jgi:orotidine-5'-phosphate decarboxylase
MGNMSEVSLKPSVSESEVSRRADHLIVALDVPSTAAAKALVLKIGDAAAFYKVGLQLFAAAGPQVVQDLVASGKKVFLDLKFHDIPNTVGAAVRSAVELGVDMLTVHAGGGAKMLTAAVEAAKTSGSGPKILAVTMLTSLGQGDLLELGIAGDVADHVIRLARIAQSAGCDGVVASPQEITAVRKALGGEMLFVTPGIRLSNSPADDQARTATPSEALRAGATHLVVGRPITAATDPAAAARAILKEMASV